MSKSNAGRKSKLSQAVAATASRAAAKLNAKQIRFVDQYMVDLNATQAAVRAGYSPKTAYSQGHELLKHPEIARLIAARQQATAAKTEITAEVVLSELLRLARVDVGAAFDENGRLLPIREIPEDIRRAICGVETDELFEGRGRDREAVGVTRKVKFWDKARALELLARHLGILRDRVDNLNIDLAQLSDEEIAAIARGEDPLAVLARTPRRG